MDKILELYNKFNEFESNWINWDYYDIIFWFKILYRYTYVLLIKVKNIHMRFTCNINIDYKS